MWENKREIREIRTEVAKNTEALNNLSANFEVLSAQQPERLPQITQQESEVPQKVKPSTSARNIISKTSKYSTEPSSKLDIFKRIIEDNIELRKAIV